MKRESVFFFGLFILVGLVMGCGQGGTSSSTTTSTSTTSTTTTLTWIRLYYTYTSEAGANVNIGSAYLSNGITFAAEALPRLTATYIGGPDVFKVDTNNWQMFYSKPLTAEVLSKNYLYFATAEAPAGAFV